MRSQAVFVAIAAALTMAFDEPSPTPAVRTDGLYHTGGVAVAGVGLTTAYLRFDASGLVQCTSSLGNPQQVIRWLRPDNLEHPRGDYTIDGDTIRFACASSYGTVHYEGVIAGDVLTITWQSDINGASGRQIYRFVAVSPPMPKGALGHQR